MTVKRIFRARGLAAGLGAAALLAAGLGYVAPATAVAPPAAPDVPAQAAVHVFAPAGGKGRPVPGSSSSNLVYGGGTAGIGVETTPKVYLVLWGSQWTNNDPKGEAGILEAMLGKVGGSGWLGSVTQYCQGILKGASCTSTSDFAGNPTGILAAVWADSSTAAPTHPKQSQLAAEAVNAANHFGNGATSNATAQYVVATATGNSASGFGTRYCAWHSSTSSASTGTVAYTNLPYITDAGASCGAGFNGLAATAGITIVEGHELAETITDQFPSTGWTDGSGAENGDKCAWISSGTGATTDVSLNGTKFPMQSLWSNAANGGAGGCVLS